MLGMDTILVSILHDLFDRSPNFFEPHLGSRGDIAEYYHPNQMWRRTSDTRAIEKGVGKKDIDVVNFWSDTEHSRKSQPN